MGTLVKILILIIPFLIGWAISDLVFPAQTNDANTNTKFTTLKTNPSVTPSAPPKISPFANIQFDIHRNGEATPCGHTTISLSDAFTKLNNEEGDLPDNLDSMSKYKLDQLLTATIGKHALPLTSCGVEKAPPEIKGKMRLTWGRGENYHIDGIDSEFLTYCDMGEEHTPLLPDHGQLVEVMTGNINTYPCNFHTREGLRFTSYQQLVDYVQQQQNSQSTPSEEECSMEEDGVTVCSDYTPITQVHLYAVPAGRPFVFAPSYIGEIFEIPHVLPKSEKPISLVVMSLSPRVFDVLNFFDTEESESIVKKALAETSETHKIKRSSTGASGYNLNSQRTSENGFDTHGKTAITVKK